MRLVRGRGPGRPRIPREPEPINFQREITRARRAKKRSRRSIWTDDGVGDEIEIGPHSYSILAERSRLHLAHGVFVEGQMITLSLYAIWRYPAWRSNDLPRQTVKADEAKSTRIEAGALMPILIPRGTDRFVLVNQEDFFNRWPSMPNSRVLAFVVTKPKANPRMIQLIRYCAIDARHLDEAQVGRALDRYTQILRDRSDPSLLRDLLKMTDRGKSVGVVEKLATSFVRLFDVRSRSFRSRARRTQK